MSSCYVYDNNYAADGIEERAIKIMIFMRGGARGINYKQSCLLMLRLSPHT